VPVITDIHSPEQAERAAAVVDILQIPAFLCRQTDLLVAAGKTGTCVNIKKGQFLAPELMAHAAAKVVSGAPGGRARVMLTERGTCFGYGDLVVDMRALATMRATGLPVVYDATHSVQKPGGRGVSSGGDRSMIAVLARAAVAAGIDALFVETHPNPAEAFSDADSQLPHDELPALLASLAAIRAAAGDGR
jgi:2-dehydro-3-deoxyphosphooctonate aldolase (KDO 8-P synthase)